MNFTKITKGLMAGALSALMSTAAFADDMTLRFAGVFPIDHQGTKMMEQVAADVAAAGVGLKIDVFPANQLGSGEALFEDVARGNIDLGRHRPASGIPVDAVPSGRLGRHEQHHAEHGFRI